MVSEEARSLKLEICTPNIFKCVFKIKQNNTVVYTLETKLSTLSFQFSHSFSFLILPLKQFNIKKLKGIQVIVYILEPVSPLIAFKGWQTQ